MDELLKPLKQDTVKAEIKTPPPEKKSPRGRKPKSKDNSISHELLRDYYDLKSASEDYPFIEDIIIGISKLAWGGERGLVPNQLFILLANLTEITSAHIQERTWCSSSHSRKLADALRLCAESIERTVSNRPKKSATNNTND